MIVLYLSPYKPIDDPRSTQKWLRNLSQLPSNELFTLSTRPTDRPQPTSNHSSEGANQWYLGGSRWARYRQTGKILFQVKPHLIICNSPDFLPLILLHKILFGCRVILDLLENYEQNILWNQRRRGLPKWLVQTFEKFTRSLYSFCNLVTVAEPCLFHELAPWLGSSTQLLSNHNSQAHTITKSSSPQAPQGLSAFLLTGTLGRHYGTLDVLDWYEAQKDDCTLEILGHSPDPSFASLIQKRVQVLQHRRGPSTAYKLHPGYVSHAGIIGAISRAAMLLLPYRLSPAVQDRLPVKIFEAAQFGTHVSFTDNPAWRRQCATLGLPYSLFPPSDSILRPNPALANSKALHWADQATMDSIRVLISSWQKIA